jgi:hypothetical protein
MNTSSNTGSLVLAGHPHLHALDHVRRFCGLEWSGGAGETWAFRYFDLVETETNRMDPVDVLAAAALHPGLSRDDLAWFEDHREALDCWLADVTTAGRLGDSNVRVALERLCDFDGVTLTLLTKVLHRKRPHVVPLVDRHVVDRYRPITGERKPIAAWPALLDAMVVDLERNTDALAAIRTELWNELGVDVSALRICDIAIWMEARS